MLIDTRGVLVDPRIVAAVRPAIEGRPMPKVHGIVVHQTDSSTASSTLSQYTRPRSNGAHFLVDKDGTIYQTASVHKQTSHVGMLKSRCIATRTCPPTEFRAISHMNVRDLSRHEEAKPWPQRYPSNHDAIDVELVGRFLPDQIRYEAVTSAQNASLRWLVNALAIALGVPLHEVFRHPDLSYKEPSEAETAAW